MFTHYKKKKRSKDVLLGRLFINFKQRHDMPIFWVYMSIADMYMFEILYFTRCGVYRQVRTKNFFPSQYSTL